MSTTNFKKTTNSPLIIILHVDWYDEFKDSPANLWSVVGSTQFVVFFLIRCTHF
jgi:hypothetical protein